MMFWARRRRFSFQIYRAAQPARGWPTALVLIGIFAALAVSIRVFCRDAHGWSPFWPANGAIAAALLVLPKRLGFAVLATDVILNVIENVFFYNAVQLIVFDALLNGLAAVLLAILVRNFCGAATDLSRMRRLLTFMVLAMVAAGAEAAVGEFLNLIARAPDLDIGGWLWWTLCDGLGLMLAMPTVLLCVKNKRYVNFSKTGLLNKCALFILIAGVATVSFAQTHSSLFIFVYPLLVLMAFTAGPVWVLASVLTVSIVVSALTIHGYGPLVIVALGDARVRQNALQQILLSLFVCAVPANNALGEMGRSAQRLRRLHAVAREARSAAVAANLAKSQFIANVSHEIRTPLNGVLGMAQVLAAGDLSALQRQRVEIVHSSGEVLLGILNDVLDFSKIEAGKLDLETTPFDVAKVASEVHGAFSAIAESKNLQFSLRIDRGSSDEPYLGDPTRVRQIISNLVSNALKFTLAGGVAIDVSCLEDGIVVSVRDSGIGIPADRLPRLFRQFEQADASTTRQFGGTGLGLSICHELCQRMGGQIDVESQLGAGSTFTVRLPLRRVEATPDALFDATEPRAPCDDARVPELRVLAAEDNKINQLVLMAFLEQIGVTPTIVEDGALAIEAWRTGAFDLVLMDMQMPVIDGLTAVRAIRAEEALASTLPTPIIALTADVMSHHLQDYRRAGVDAVVAKPIQFAQLVQAIQGALEPVVDTQTSLEEDRTADRGVSSAA